MKVISIFRFNSIFTNQKSLFGGGLPRIKKFFLNTLPREPGVIYVWQADQIWEADKIWMA